MSNMGTKPYAEIEVGDYVKVEHTVGQGTRAPRTAILEGTVFADEEGVLRVGDTNGSLVDYANLTRDEDGYLPSGVLLISHVKGGAR